MKTKFNALMLTFIALVLSAKAFSQNPTIGIFLGYNQDTGYSFSITDGLSAKVLTFGEIQDSTLLSKYSLKDNSLIGTSFNLTFDSGLHEETGGVELTILSLDKTTKPESLLEKHSLATN